jgi:para-aminobenzoate synthetase / 4-amino-4-deoxychorismate lyase
MSAVRFALFEDNQAAIPKARLLQGCKAALHCQWPDLPQAAIEQIEHWQQAGYWVALAAHYELGLALEPKLQHLLEPGTNLLEAYAFSTCSILEGDALEVWWDTRLASLSPQQRDAGMLCVRESVSEAQYVERANRVLHLIAQGDCYQVNLTFPLKGLFCGSPEALYAQLRKTQPVAHGAMIQTSQGYLLSRSPELFVERIAERLRCRPMKGTVARTSALSDAQQHDALMSEKNRAENLMIVDLIRNDLGRLAPPGGVQVTQLFETERYPSVMQMTSTIEASDCERSLYAVLRALYPCGSVTGAPKIRAMEIIHALEKGPRGPYCGALGWIAPSGDFSFNVPIRTLVCQTDFQVRLDVGSGIVSDSVATDEYAECLIKSRFATQTAHELKLIETMRAEVGSERGIEHLDLHLARLLRSATELGFLLNETRIRDEIYALFSSLIEGQYRVRLILDRTGEIGLTATPFDTIATKQWVGFADYTLQSADPRLRHKTTARSFYDEAIRKATQQGLFDLIYFNEQGQACEGARSNLFVEIGGCLLTPPISCGLLPGVLRSKLLAEGRATEAIVLATDIFTADRIWMGNALHGLVEVRLKKALSSPPMPFASGESTSARSSTDRSAPQA